MIITQFDDVFAESLKSFDASWDELVTKISAPNVFYKKSSMPLIKLAKFGDLKTDKGSLRHDSNVLEVHGLEGDYDGEEISIEEGASRLKRHGITAALYTSPSHSTEKPRWRVLAPFSSCKEPEERHYLMGMLNAALGGILASESFTLSQSYYFGKSSNEYAAINIEGEPIDFKDGQWDPIFPSAKTSKALSVTPGSKAPMAERIEDAIKQIYSNEAYYQPALSLTAMYFNSGMSRDAAKATVKSILEAHPNPNADIDQYIKHVDSFLADGFADSNKPGAVKSDPGRSLEYFSGDELPDLDELEVLHDELIERTLQTSGIAMIFGESNSGKTFMAIHMCMCVATGMQFLGRNVTQTAVLYVAAESPAGVRMRARAWQKQHGMKSGNFFVCPDQVNLYENEFDSDAIIRLIKKIEATHGVNIGLVVFDTLARISAGANENSNDMGKVMVRCDAIGSSIGALIGVIHHSGKDSLKGARGWSGMRAHIDTEIEVSQSNGISVAEVTKQREIEGKGDRLAFSLEPVQIGMNKWGNIRSTCWVNSADLPPKTLLLPPTELAILKFMNRSNFGVTRAEISAGINKDKSNSNKAVKKLLDDELIYEQMGKLYIKHEDRSEKNV